MTIAQDILCDYVESYYPLRKNDQRHDNVKFFIRPLECKLEKTYFRNMELFGSTETFHKYCVDLENGDAKPQIRIHGNAAFNVTNLLQFENIEFTGEDNLVSMIDSTVDETLMQDILNASPFKFCEYESEPTGYLETASVTQTQGVSANFNYTCHSGFNATLNQIPTQVDEACADTFATTPQGVRASRGEPNHADFFTRTDIISSPRGHVQMYNIFKTVMESQGSSSEVHLD